MKCGFCTFHQNWGQTTSNTFLSNEILFRSNRKKCDEFYVRTFNLSIDLYLHRKNLGVVDLEWISCVCVLMWLIWRRCVDVLSIRVIKSCETWSEKNRRRRFFFLCSRNRIQLNAVYGQSSEVMKLFFTAHIIFLLLLFFKSHHTKTIPNESSKKWSGLFIKFYFEAE